MTEAITKPTTPKRRRPRGEGSLYEDKHGRWHGAVITTDPATGARSRHVVSGKTAAVVRERLAALKVALATL